MTSDFALCFKSLKLALMVLLSVIVDVKELIVESNRSQPSLLLTTTKGEHTYMGLYEEFSTGWSLVGSETELLAQSQPFVADIDGDFV